MIDQRRTYLLASVLWAIVLAPLVALSIVAFGAGISWLYLFGDEPWPTSVEWVLPLLGLAAGTITAAAIIWAGYSYGKHLQHSSANDTRVERRSDFVLILTPVVVLLLIILVASARLSNYEEAMNSATAREENFADLLSRNQEIDSLRIVAETNENFRAVITFAGMREDLYRLDWTIYPSNLDTSLILDSRLLELDAGQNQIEIMFSMSELRERYQAIILKGGTGVIVEEPFIFEVLLTPVLSEDGLFILPPGEQRRLQAGESLLTDKAAVEFPVWFLIP